LKQRGESTLPAFRTRFRVRRVTTGFRRLKEEEGSGLVEYALIFIVFITMLLGIMDFCRLLYTYHFVSNAAREATRYASVRGSTCDDDSSCSLATPDTGPAAPAKGNTVVQDYVTMLAVPAGINTSSTGCAGSPCLTTTPTWNPAGSNGPTICSTAVNGSGPTPNYPGCTVEVQVSYTFNFLFPLVHISPVTLSSTSEMVIVH
jgi:Flp pilus assembly protein TadG